MLLSPAEISVLRLRVSKSVRRKKQWARRRHARPKTCPVTIEKRLKPPNLTTTLYHRRLARYTQQLAP